MNDKYNKALIQRWWKGEITTNKLLLLWKTTGYKYKVCVAC